MKKLLFILPLFLFGCVIGGDNTETTKDGAEIKLIYDGSRMSVFTLSVDSIQYVVVTTGNNVGITKHKDLK